MSLIRIIVDRIGRDLLRPTTNTPQQLKIKQSTFSVTVEEGKIFLIINKKKAKYSGTKGMVKIIWNPFPPAVKQTIKVKLTIIYDNKKELLIFRDLVLQTKKLESDEK